MSQTRAIALLALAGLLLGCRSDPPPLPAPNDLAWLEGEVARWDALRGGLDSLEGTWISTDGLSHFMAWRHQTELPVIRETLGADAVGRSEMWHYFRAGRVYHIQTRDVRPNPMAPGGADSVRVRLYFAEDGHSLLAEASVNGAPASLQRFEIQALQLHAEELYRKAQSLPGQDSANAR